MSILRTGVLALALAFAATSALTATVGYSEGSRPQVAGTIDMGDTSSKESKAFDLVGNAGGAFDGGFGAGDSINLHGRIVSSVDNFKFTATSSFVIEFIFGGYDLANGGSVSASGFVSQTKVEKMATFVLKNMADSSTVSTVYTTDITSADGNGGSAMIFAGGPGSYIFAIDGRPGPNTPVGLYDVRISAVPLPASVFLMFAGLCGLGLLKRRTSA